MRNQGEPQAKVNTAFSGQSLEIRPLTALRFLAAMLVFLSHYSSLPYGRVSQPWQAIVVEGHAGVTIFFTLSGFLIALRCYPALADGTFSLYDYGLKRFARIVPLYWVVLALTFALEGATPYQFYAPVPLVNWTFTQAFFSGLATSVIVTGWSLTVEVSFYVVAPWLLYSVVGRGLRVACLTLAVWAVGLFFIGLSLVALSRAAGLDQAYGFMSSLEFMGFFTLFGRGFDFCFGIVLALVYLRHGDNVWASASAPRRATALFIVSAISIGLLQIAINALGGAPSAWPLNLPIALLAALMIFSLTCPTALPARLLSGRLPVYLGRVSYALYLLQTIPVFRMAYVSLAGWPLVGLPAFYLLATLVSALFYEFIERPSRRIIRRAGAGRAPKADRSIDSP